jgi:branched-chain amino acid transport system permease protein
MFQFTGKMIPYYLMLVLMLLALLINHLVAKKRFGLYLLAIRDDEASAAALGVNTLRYKMVAMALSSFMTALGGSFLAQYTMYIQPDFTLSLSQSIDILMRPIIGGVGTVFGPVLGAFVLGPLSELTRTWLSSYHGVHLVVYGALLVGFMVFLPDGLMGLWHRYRTGKATREEEP